ncbi:MAG TPA: DUF3592 domain-containing protein [Chthoniobacteraceae bacterium]|nr:DUF3592 domain-containing protein [Chthoniobacteraceae bacterium]
MGKPLSNKANRRQPVWFFVVFTLAGLGFLFPTFFLPTARIISALGWVKTPCVIQSSSVARKQMSKGPAYSVALQYAYSFGGKNYTGSLYHFYKGTSTGYSHNAAIVARYPRGLNTYCYVNPADPRDSVINRGFAVDAWVALLPLLFVCIGVWCIVHSLRGGIFPIVTQWHPASLRHAADFHGVPAGPRELRPSATPLGKLSGMIFAAVFWNGIISIFVVKALGDWRAHHPQWFLNIFLIPFVLVGLGLIVGVAYSLLALFNPRAHLVVNPGAVALGDPRFTLQWSLQGRASALTALSITLEGSEEAIYQNGKNTSTATNVFFSQEIVNTTSQTEFASGAAQAAVPLDTMHSLDTGHNKITWKLRVKGKIPRWPDMTEDYPLIVLPARKNAP